MTADGLSSAHCSMILAALLRQLRSQRAPCFAAQRILQAPPSSDLSPNKASQQAPPPSLVVAFPPPPFHTPPALQARPTKGHHTSTSPPTQAEIRYCGCSTSSPCSNLQPSSSSHPVGDACEMDDAVDTTGQVGIVIPVADANGMASATSWPMPPSPSSCSTPFRGRFPLFLFASLPSKSFA